uniref:Uncharacterized protein n=1 Tax=Vespula pensylvanica TaxID=30213 RepID=A0A834UCD0_VESPE|nr:hypothetical protein H0235_006237 [Vespula pensylvanica]
MACSLSGMFVCGGGGGDGGRKDDRGRWARSGRTRQGRAGQGRPGQTGVKQESSWGDKQNRFRKILLAVTRALTRFVSTGSLHRMQLWRRDQNEDKMQKLNDIWSLCFRI